jgi:bla regulator protein BlaR1
MEFRTMSWLLAYGITNAILALPIAGLAYLVGQHSRLPALAHLLWIAVLVKLITPPMVSVPVGWEINPAKWTADSGAPAQPVSSAAQKPLFAQAARQSDNNLARATVATTISTRERRLDRRPTLPASQPIVSLATVLSIAGLIWIAGALILAGRTAYQVWCFHRKLQSSGRSDDWLNSRVAKVARLAGLTRWPKVVVVDGTFSPMLWGLGRRAKLVFPSELALRLDREACDSLLLHELAHYWRNDHWVRLLELVCQTLFWWHPVVWLSRRGIEASEELCCDAWVIARQNGSPRSYAQALLTTIDFLNEETPWLPPIASGLGEISLLRRRLTRIMLGDLATGLSPLAKFAVITCAVIFAPLGPALLADSYAKVAPAVLNEEAGGPVRLTERKRLPRTADGRTTRPTTPVSTVASAMPRTAAGPTRLRTPADHWATAVSPSGKYRFEARGGLKTVLVDATNPSWKIDFTSNQIASVSFAPDDRFATGQEGDTQVRIFDAAGAFLRKLSGADEAITSVAFSPNARWVAAGVSNGQVIVWDATTAEKIAQLDSGGPVSCVRWSPTGDRLAISVSAWNDDSGEPRVLIWDPKQSQPLASFSLDRPVSAVVWPRESIVAAISWDGAGLMWDITTGDVRTHFDIGKDLPSAAAWSPECPLVQQWIEGVLAGEETL